jgi:hypothetical protein
MENAHFIKEDDADSRAFPFADLRAERHKKSFNVCPTNRTACGSGEYQFQRGAGDVSSLYGWYYNIVPFTRHFSVSQREHL